MLKIRRHLKKFNFVTKDYELIYIDPEETEVEHCKFYFESEYSEFIQELFLKLLVDDLKIFKEDYYLFSIDNKSWSTYKVKLSLEIDHEEINV